MKLTRFKATTTTKAHGRIELVGVMISESGSKRHIVQTFNTGRGSGPLDDWWHRRAVGTVMQEHRLTVHPCDLKTVIREKIDPYEATSYSHDTLAQQAK